MLQTMTDYYYYLYCFELIFHIKQTNKYNIIMKFNVFTIEIE